MPPTHTDSAAQSYFEELIDDGWSMIERWCTERRDESASLEFKCLHQPSGITLPEPTRDEVAEAISGFANAEGGVLVLGIDTESRKLSRQPDRAQKPRPLRDLDQVLAKLRKLVHTIVQPSVPGVRVEKIEYENNTGAIVIFVPPNATGPHRTTNISTDRTERYYLRTVTETAVMSHGTLAALFGRRPQAVLRVIARMHEKKYLWLYVRNAGFGTADRPTMDLIRNENWPFNKASSWSQLGIPMSDGREVARFAHIESSFLLSPGMEDLVAACTLPILKQESHSIQLEGTVYAAHTQPLRFCGVVRPTPEKPVVVIPNDLGNGWEPTL
jgi:hypothetical protein